MNAPQLLNIILINIRAITNSSLLWQAKNVSRVLGSGFWVLGSGFWVACFVLRVTRDDVWDQLILDVAQLRFFNKLDMMSVKASVVIEIQNTMMESLIIRRTGSIIE
jgi:hypothetical protein